MCKILILVVSRFKASHPILRWTSNIFYSSPICLFELPVICLPLVLFIIVVVVFHSAVKRHQIQNLKAMNLLELSSIGLSRISHSMHFQWNANAPNAFSKWLKNFIIWTKIYRIFRATIVLMIHNSIYFWIFQIYILYDFNIRPPAFNENTANPFKWGIR